MGEVEGTSSIPPRAEGIDKEKAWHSFSFISTDFPRAVQQSTDSAIRSFQHSSSTHFRALRDFIPQLRSQYRTYENAFFLKVKDELKIAKEHPAVAGGTAVIVTLLLLRGPRKFLFRHTLGRFQSEEKESGKLLERAGLAEKEMNRGKNDLMNAGSKIHSLARSVRKAEAEATDLMDVLREIPGREPLKLRAEVALMASQLQGQKVLMDKKMMKISELGLPI